MKTTQEHALECPPLVTKRLMCSVQGPVAHLRAVGGLAMLDSLSSTGRPMANSPPENVGDRYLGWVMPLAYCCPELTEGAIVTLKSAVRSSLRTMHHKPQKPQTDSTRNGHVSALGAVLFRVLIWKLFFLHKEQDVTSVLSPKFLPPRATPFTFCKHLFYTCLYPCICLISHE